jgi:Ni,Fe-hydrogenase III large subunit
VIEPGHFRFQCHGEEILHLEIQLGYQHRAVEELLPKKNRSQQLVLVESIAGDSVIAHTTAFCSAIEALAGVSPSLREQAVRGIAAELERVAMHLATLSGIATDIGFALPAAAFGGLRTAVINLTASICGSRFGRGWIIPGRLAQVKIKDPSFHNWQGLALAVRENGVSDFPLCNKSFDLSYAGHDL